MLRENKRKLEQYVRKSLYGSRLFFSVRDFYQRLLDREKMAVRKKMRALYSPYIRHGDLVFDVGANVGDYAELFAELGARVVAIEPNPRCCEKLSELALARDIRVENCAAGDAPGRLPLHICVENPTISTVADEWYEAAQHSAVHGKNKWLESVQVEVVTLDHLTKRYGVPTFVKIDVEGFDDRVLRGMSFQPSALSFEFNREIPQVALRCLDAPILTQDYEFNYLLGMNMELASDHWMDSNELRSRIFAGEKSYGDVLARRKGGSSAPLPADKA
jgi:FkbM family methyltransferase